MNQKISLEKIDFKTAMKTAEEVRNIFLQIHLPKDMSISEMMVLNFLYRNQNKSLKEIKEEMLSCHLGMNKSRMDVRIAKKITSLSNKKLITKTQNREDKRISIIKVTKKGHEVIEQFFKKSEKKWEEVKNG